MAVTRNDIARRARVPPGVVSYVLNDGPRPVAKETRKRVLDAVKELGDTGDVAEVGAAGRDRPGRPAGDLERERQHLQRLAPAGRVFTAGRGWRRTRGGARAR